MTPTSSGTPSSPFLPLPATPRPDFLVVTEDDRYGSVKRELCTKVWMRQCEQGGAAGSQE